MIRIQLTEEKKKQLEYYRGQASSKNSEKALMMIKSSEGKSPKEIAEILKRSTHTIRKWLKRSSSEKHKILIHNSYIIIDLYYIKWTHCVPMYFPKKS